MAESYNPMRYGVFGLNPRGTDAMLHAINVAQGIGKLGEDYQKTKGLRLENDALPDKQQAALDYVRAQIGEAGARSNLYGAQGQEALGRIPLMEAQAEAERSRGGLYGAEAQRARAMAAYQNMLSGLGIKGVAAGAGMPGVSGTGTIDPNAKVTSLEAPTMASMTNAQNRIAAEKELEKLRPIVNQGLSHYNGPGGSVKLASDSFRASVLGDKAAQKRLYEYSLAKRFVPEVAAINAKQATGQLPGIEMTQHFEKSMFPNTPGSIANYTIPNSIINQSQEAYGPTQTNAVNTAINAERGGFPEQVGIPAWTQGPIEYNQMGRSSRSMPKQGIIETPIQAQAAQPAQNYSSADLEYTAQKHGMTVEQVKEKLGIK